MLINQSGTLLNRELMKKFLILVFAISSLWTTAQNYSLFNSVSKKVFTEFPKADSTYSLSFDSVRTAGIDSVYYPYYGVEDYYFTSENCEFWGPPDCHPQIKPIWIGQKIIADNAANYWFFNNQGDTLNFDFGMQTGGNSQFYEDAFQRFEIFSEAIDTMSVLGLVDSVKIYRILHTDLQGNTINSALNNQAIIVGKNFGLVRLFQVDQFPEVLNPLAILGNFSPEAGLYKLTNAMIYDHQPGDEIQYQKIFYSYNTPPYDHYNRFIKYVYVDRQDTQDSIIYLVNRTVFDMGETNEITTTLYLKYARNGFIAELPYDKFYPDYTLNHRYLKLVDYCGVPMWTYSVKPEYLAYCLEDNCWGPFDIPGPPPIEEIRYVAGLGLYIDESFIGYPPYAYTNSEKVTYFKKNGIACGEEVIVGISSPMQVNCLLTISPNPASDKLFLHLEKAITGKIRIYNTSGQMLMEVSTANIENGIDIRRLSPGMYFVEIDGNDQKAMGKFIKL
ncbi:MAG TPA: hypothetical protein DCL86_15615 [Bacteroidales bacterium]|nr:hypothetical protein [Bacteroidales bacterium]